MTYGFRKAGINVIAGIDIDAACKETYEFNNKGSKFIETDIKEYTFKQLKNDTSIKENDDSLIFIGCSPCQYWSIIKTIKTKSKLSKNLLTDFQRFVEHFKPGYVVVENVPGILKKEKESGLKKFVESLKAINYTVKYKILNANHYGVPQRRRRFTLIASRVNKQIELPEPDKQDLPTSKRFYRC